MSPPPTLPFQFWDDDKTVDSAGQPAVFMPAPSLQNSIGSVRIIFFHGSQLLDSKELSGKSQPEVSRMQKKNEQMVQFTQMIRKNEDWIEI